MVMAKKVDAESVPFKSVIYGQPGSGKTTLAASAVNDERFGNVLMLDAFGNPMVLRKWAKKPDIITLAEMADFNDPYEFLTEGQESSHPFCKKFNLRPPYKTLVVDGTTEVQRFITRIITGSGTLGPGDIVGALGRQGFGQLLGTMLNWAVKFISLDMNVILTCLEATKTDANTNIIHKEPLIWGQSGNEISGYVYLVTRLVRRLAAPKSFLEADVDPLKSDSINIALFEETTSYYCKDQYGLGVDHLCNPTLGRILDLIEQGSI
jgi:hypothetical protein